jgi:Hemolysin coregulated protein Hcp (TssD)
MYKAILEVDGKVYSLSSVSINAYNRGSGYDPNPNDQTLTFMIKTPKLDQFIWNWISTQNIEKRNGKVKLINSDDNIVHTIISFENGYSSSYNMNYYQNSETNETSITLCASKISIQVNSASVSSPGKPTD